MLVDEILTEEIIEKDIIEQKLAWKRSGNTVKQKYRCGSGPRKGRIVAKASQCFAPPDLKKRFNLKKTKAKKGALMARKARKTKKWNAASKRVSRLNRRR